ncbi:MAG: response regulator [Planctomycetes bacterium]|nr:response regulator [Planctomycetota bacterium]
MTTHSIATTGLLVMTGVCLSAGLHHLVVWALQKHLNTYLWFGLMASGCAAYDFTAFLMINTGNSPSHMLWYRVQLESAMLVVPVFVHYALAYANIRTPLLTWTVTAVFAVLAVLNATVPDSMLFADAHTIGVEMPWGEVLYRTVGSPEPLIWVYAAAVVGAVACVLALLVRSAARGERHVAALLVTSSLVFVMAVNDTMVDLQLLRSIYVTEYSFVPLIVLMSLALARQMRRDAQEREAAARRLVESQAKLQEAQKLETIGRLAGGIAHDFNNLLQVISGHTEVLLSSNRLDADTRRKAAHVQAAAQRAADLTRQLLAYARKQVLAPSTLDMNVATAELLAMARRVLGERVELNHQPASAPAWATADRTQLEQVLLNLLINARDAMPHGGSVTVAVRPAPLDAAFAQANPWARAGEFVRITVADTGTGMDAETLAHLFEPFFTTKGPGKGTGLGLATAWGIVQQHNGLLHVESAPGKGTSFHVYLPKAPAPASSPAQPAVQSARAAPVGSVVMLVEDETLVRELAAEVLDGTGYEVLCASSAEEAIRLFECHSERICAVISDVVMPGMNGPELLQQLRARKPGLPCVFVSGYDFGELKLAGMAAVAMLHKPFTPAQLLQELHDLQRDSGRQVAAGTTAASSRS